MHSTAGRSGATWAITKITRTRLDPSYQWIDLVGIYDDSADRPRDVAGYPTVGGIDVLVADVRRNLVDMFGNGTLFSNPLGIAVEKLGCQPPKDIIHDRLGHGDIGVFGKPRGFEAHMAELVD